MDNLEQGKDTEIQVDRSPNRIQSISHLFIGLGVFLVMFILCSLLGTAIGMKMSGLNLTDIATPEGQSKLMDSPQMLRILNFFSSSLSMLSAAFIAVLIIKAKPLKYLSLASIPSLKYTLISFLLFLTVLPVMGLLLKLNEGIDLSAISPDLQNWFISKEGENNALYEKMIGGKDNASFFANLFFMAIIPALAEELFFRGFLLRGLQGLFKNVHVAIFVSALVFAAIHMQFFKLLPMLALAMALGYLVYFTCSVWPAIIAHFVNNAMAVVTMTYFTDGSYSEVLQQEESLPWPLVGISIAALIGLFWYLNKNANPKLKNYYV